MDEDENKVRVIALLWDAEKQDLQTLAWWSGRSVSGYIRHLVNEDIEKNSDVIRDIRRRVARMAQEKTP